MQPKIVVAIGGASGSIYAKVLLDRLAAMQHQVGAVGVVMSDNAKFNWQLELGNESYQQYKNSQTTFYDKRNFMAPFASGSAQYGAMIVCPCSMGLLGRIASGISDDLTTRAADVILKERRKLVLVVRDTPYSLIHLRNMTALAEAGAIICPASPSFYSKPADFEALAATVVDRALALAGLHVSGSYEWGEGTES
jgi:4-hydroxy-3-polyprenylbenzoate decarboxylase